MYRIFTGSFIGIPALFAAVSIWAADAVHPNFVGNWKFDFEETCKQGRKICKLFSEKELERFRLSMRDRAVTIRPDGTIIHTFVKYPERPDAKPVSAPSRGRILTSNDQELIFRERGGGKATLHFNVISEEYITLFTILPYQKTGRLLPLYYKKVKDEL